MGKLISIDRKNEDNPYLLLVPFSLTVEEILALLEGDESQLESRARQCLILRVEEVLREKGYNLEEEKENEVESVE